MRMRPIKDFQFGEGVLHIDDASGVRSPRIVGDVRYQPVASLSAIEHEPDMAAWRFLFRGKDLCAGADDFGCFLDAQFKTERGFLLLTSGNGDFFDLTFSSYMYLVVSYLSNDFRLLDRALMICFWGPDKYPNAEDFDMETSVLHPECSVIDHCECRPDGRLRIRLKTEMVYEITVHDPPRRLRASWLFVDRFRTGLWNRRYLTVRWANPWLPFQQAGRDMIADWKARVRNWRAKRGD